MPRRDPRICPGCGARVEPKKTWQLISPFPDAKGRITVTIMGSFECPYCGRKWRGTISKIKVGDTVEVEAGSKKSISKPSEGVKREGPIIEIDIEEE